MAWIVESNKSIFKDKQLFFRIQITNEFTEMHK